MYKVSVIIPVYKAEKYIERCCRSLFSQTLQDIQYIFVDDCSPDSSIKIIRDTLEEYPVRKENVDIIGTDRNSGQAAARRTGYAYASGEYIIHCDSDDWVHPKMYEKLYEKSQENDADIVTCDYYRTDGCTDTYCSAGFRSERTYAHDLVAKKVRPALWNKLIARDLFTNQQFRHPVLNLGEDYAITAQIAARSERFSYVPEALYWYYDNPSSITRDRTVENLRSRFQSSYGNIKLVEDSLRESGDFKEYAGHIQAARIMDRFYLLRDYLHDDAVMSLWKECSAELPVMRCLFNGDAQLKARVMSILVDLGIYQRFH